MAKKGKQPILKIDDLHVYYGLSHVIQGVSLQLDRGVLAIVGRNGMGKTTVCDTIMGLKKAASGSIRFDGKIISNLEPNQINRLGISYVPQGRRVWPNLTVDETLRLSYHNSKQNNWTLDRIYRIFPRLGERKGNGGSQLSGGEQQMLAISRALLSNPKLMIMDEPTEGLAPVIVDQVKEILINLANEEDISILLVEQNIGVATSVSEHVGIMINGSIKQVMDAKTLAADRELQQRLLGVGRYDEETPAEIVEDVKEENETKETQTDRSSETSDSEILNSELNPFSFPMTNRWGIAHEAKDTQIDRSSETNSAEILDSEVTSSPLPMTNRWEITHKNENFVNNKDEEPKPFVMPLSERFGRMALVAGTFDTKGVELNYIRDELHKLGMPVKTVDLSTSKKFSTADVSPLQVATMHSKGASAVFTNDRGQSVIAMEQAFANWIDRESGIGGIISAGGSGGTSLATAGMRKLPVGLPKIMVSTIASGNVAEYVGPSDIMMMYSVADIQGLNLITEQVLGNAAHALAGMIAALPTSNEREEKQKNARPSIGMSMFGVTTPCIQGVQKVLEKNYECLVFHATGTGGRSMENLTDSGLISALFDLTTTEIADMLVGGVHAANADRFGAVIRTRVPYVGSVGALDMVNFGARDTVPEKFNSRNFVVHNANVTLMRTTKDENCQFGKWIGERLNEMEGPVRFLLPLEGVSALDKPGGPFHDPEADNALFDTIEETVRQSSQRKVLRIPANINDPVFIDAALTAFNEITPKL